MSPPEEKAPASRSCRVCRMDGETVPKAAAMRCLRLHTTAAAPARRRRSAQPTRCILHLNQQPPRPPIGSSTPRPPTRAHDHWAAHSGGRGSSFAGHNQSPAELKNRTALERVPAGFSPVCQLQRGWLDGDGQAAGRLVPKGTTCCLGGLVFSVLPGPAALARWQVGRQVR